MHKKSGAGKWKKHGAKAFGTKYNKQVVTKYVKVYGDYGPMTKTSRRSKLRETSVGSKEYVLQNSDKMVKQSRRGNVQGDCRPEKEKRKNCSGTKRQTKGRRESRCQQPIKQGVKKI